MRKEPARNEQEFLSQSGVESEDHVRQKHVVVLTGGHDKNE